MLITSPNQSLNTNGFIRLHNIIKLNNNIILIDNIDKIEPISSDNDHSYGYPLHCYGYPPNSYTYKVVIRGPHENVLNLITDVANISIDTIYYYHELEQGSKLKCNQTQIIQSALQFKEKDQVICFEFIINTDGLKPLSEDDSFLIRTLLLQKL